MANDAGHEFVNTCCECCMAGLVGAIIRYNDQQQHAVRQKMLIIISAEFGSDDGMKGRGVEPALRQIRPLSHVASVSKPAATVS